MTLKLKEPLIDKDNAFANCKLDREQYAEVLTSIVENYKDGFVLGLNNKWGEGKTTFVKMWQQYLEYREFKTLYFNAWENDFQNEVIIALLSELNELTGNTKEQFDSFLNKTAKFLKKVSPAVAKGVARKAIGDEAVTDMVEATTEFITGEIEKNILDFNEKKKGAENFRESLKTYVKEVNSVKPVIFFIDELDRCRPTYAVEVLEQVKHLFSVEGIIFVLSIDKEQLGNSIRGFYGSDLIEADEYLRRFIDIEYSIPKPTAQKFIAYLYDYFEFDSFIKLPERKGNTSVDSDTIKSISDLLYGNDDFNLRQLEKIFARIKVVIQSLNSKEYMLPEVIIFISYIHLKYRDVFNNIFNFRYTIQELSDELMRILSYIKDDLERKKVLNLSTSIIYRYWLDYTLRYHNSRITLVKTKDNIDILNFESSMNNNMILTVIKNLERGNNSLVGIKHILNKYSLLDRLQD